MTPYYAPEGGGLERYAREILGRLSGRGHLVEAICATRGAPGTDVVDGVRVQRFRPTAIVGNTPIDAGLAVRVSRLLKASRPDVVVAHTPVPYPAQVAYLAAWRARVPFVTTYHAGRLRGSSRALEMVAALDRATLEARMLAGSARLIAVGHYVRDHALAKHEARVHVVPPGVDHARFSPGRERSDRDVLFVGPLDRSYRWKGVDVLLDAFGLVHRRLPGARLTLVGDGDRFDELADRVRRGDGAVRLVGRLSDDALVAEYRRATVTVLPSTTDAESFGMVLAEANACGCPVVGSRIGGIPEFVRDGDNGFLAAPGDAEDLARAIVSVLVDPDAAAAMGKRGRQRVVAEHDWDALAMETERVLELAVGGAASS